MASPIELDVTPQCSGCPRNKTISPRTIPAISLPPDYKIGEIDSRWKSKAKLSAEEDAPLGVLSNFKGTWKGPGFNNIFRPASGAPTTTTFDNPIHPPPPFPPSQNVLELNLTMETLVFSDPVGNTPNRGLAKQADITLNGICYLQTVHDVINVETGKADGPPILLHVEPGLWMHIPATTNPSLGASIVRMGSIPHGTTIYAQAPKSAFQYFNGPPDMDPVDITPFAAITKRPNKFISQIASRTDTPRIPQDLTKFIAEGTITQAILDDPVTVLRDAIKGQKITETIVFKVSTTPDKEDEVYGGGVANIDFLQGARKAKAHANAEVNGMTATFWIETVEHNIDIPRYKPGEAPLMLSPARRYASEQLPVFEITPPYVITKPKAIVVYSKQIQYRQTVFLEFAGIVWPHVSVATLVPTEIQIVPWTPEN